MSFKKEPCYCNKQRKLNPNSHWSGLPNLYCCHGDNNSNHGKHGIHGDNNSYHGKHGIHGDNDSYHGEHAIHGDNKSNHGKHGIHVKIQWGQLLMTSFKNMIFTNLFLIAKGNFFD